MGEAKRRRETGEPLWRWKNPTKEPPPREAYGLVVLVTITCDCAKGGQVALTAGRMDGEWVIEDFEHDFEIMRWLRLPDFPKPHQLMQ